jgi:hypothetical protein
MRFVCYALMAGLAALPGARAQEKKPATDVASYKPVAAAAGKVKEVILFEGFPHPVFEPKLFKQEKETRNQFRYQGFLFYESRPRLREKDAEALRKVFADSGNFTAWRGEKKCGGFHPDFMVQWKVGDDIYRVQICFGCVEIKAFGPKGAVRLDMTQAAKKSLEATLRRYQYVLRPKPKEG